MKAFKSLLFVLAAFLSANGYSQSDSVQIFPKYTGWVNDFENILTDEQETELAETIAAFNLETGVEIAIVTLAPGDMIINDLQAYSLALAQHWGVGQKDRNNGVLIAISKGKREIRIQNGLGIENVMSDAETKKIIDLYFIPGFKKGDYFAGTKSGLEQIIAFLDKAMK